MCYFSFSPPLDTNNKTVNKLLKIHFMRSLVTVLFPPAVALVCAAAGPQALSSLRPPGLTEEEASACRALHHQRYIQKPKSHFAAQCPDHS